MTEPPAEMIERARLDAMIAMTRRQYDPAVAAQMVRMRDALAAAQSEIARVRAEALEEAAKIVENIPDIRCLDHVSGAVSYTPPDKDDIAAAIRSLINHPTDEKDNTLDFPYNP